MPLPDTDKSAFRKNWWKVLCVVLLTWSLTAGLLLPLRVGVMNVEPGSVKSGDDIELKVECYNAHLKENYADKNIQSTAWLHIDSSFKIDNGTKKIDSTVAFTIRSRKCVVLDDNHAIFSFKIPEFLPSESKLESASLLINVGENAQAIRPEAVTITQDSINAVQGKAAWNATLDIQRIWRFQFPFRNLLYETIRNTFFHVPMWFVMFTLFGIAVYHSVRYLLKNNIETDLKAAAYTQTGVLFGFLGLFTGGFWAKYAWGQAFPMDIKIIMTYTCLAIYLAYFLLRSAFDNFEQRARISAAYSIFAFVAIIPLIYVVPKLSQDSLHPGNGNGNPAFGSQDLDNTLRLVFYPASIGWILLGLWIASLVVRYQKIKSNLEYQ